MGERTAGTRRTAGHRPGDGPAALARAVAVAAVVAVLLAACGAPSAGTGPPPPPPPTPPGPEVAADLARAVVPAASYPVPTAPLPGVARLAGRTVWYVPLTASSSQFTVTAGALRSALATVGMSLQVCDGQATAAGVDACVGRATATRAGAVVTDSVPYAMVGPGLDGARAAGIPVLVTDQLPNSARPADATLAYLEGSARAQLMAVADWIVEDSAGSASVLINQSADSTTTGDSVDALQSRLATRCPACRVRINRVSSADPGAIASSTRDALAAAPDVGYVISQFDQYLGPTADGVAQAGRGATVKGASTAAQLGGLRMLAAGQFLSVDAGQASAFQGWVSADAAMRLMLGLPVPPATVPVRLFTRATIGTVPLTPQAEASGEWFGPTDFPAAFTRLWGVD